ncbi:hypothetical protein COB72_02045 [bacterium]|nr:MAG: hypothetical protein COB72_02045 [bacterium]
MTDASNGYDLADSEGAGGQSVRAAVMEQAMEIAGEMPVPVLRSLVCPYCGTVTEDSGRCSGCSGRFDPLSRQATQNQMGPWSIRDDRQPHRPGCTYQMITRLVGQGVIGAESILRGPSTRQFWTLARDTPGVAHLLGSCHSCQAEVKPDAFACPSCHASFTVERDRQHLGLGPSRPLPGQGLPEVLALHAEPASNMNQNAGVVSTPIGAGADGLGSTIGAKSGEQPTELLADRQQVEEAARLAKRWKKAWESERKRAWVVIVASLCVATVALVYAVMIGAGASETDSVVDSGQIPAEVDE